MAKRQSPFSLVLLAVGGAIVWGQVQDRGGASDPDNASFRPLVPCSEANDCTETGTVQQAAGGTVLSASSVCGDVGYLCVEAQNNGSQRILRWPEDTGQLRIRVPLPSGVSASHARDLQSAAVRGIQYWQRRPFDLVIDTHPTALEPADFEVTWGRGLSGSQLGLTEYRMTSGRDGPKFEVRTFALAIHSPGSRSYELPPEQVLLTAAHEMGHALGLPHSDSERDVMYPTNTARNLSTRDFRTLAALYRMPIGVEIKKDG